MDLQVDVFSSVCVGGDVIAKALKMEWKWQME